MSLRWNTWDRRLSNGWNSQYMGTTLLCLLAHAFPPMISVLERQARAEALTSKEVKISN